MPGDATECGAGRPPSPTAAPPTTVVTRCVGARRGGGDASGGALCSECGRWPSPRPPCSACRSVAFASDACTACVASAAAPQDRSVTRPTSTYASAHENSGRPAVAVAAPVAKDEASCRCRERLCALRVPPAAIGAGAAAVALVSGEGCSRSTRTCAVDGPTCRRATGTGTSRVAVLRCASGPVPAMPPPPPPAATDTKPRRATGTRRYAAGESPNAASDDTADAAGGRCAVPTGDDDGGASACDREFSGAGDASVDSPLGGAAACPPLARDAVCRRSTKLQPPTRTFSTKASENGCAGVGAVRTAEPSPRVGDADAPRSPSPRLCRR